MLEKLRFYVRHSLNDLRVNGQRTVFALLCIAAGVGAIVSLQTLGVMIDDTLTGSLQESNRGDLRLVPDQGFGDDEGMSSFGGQRDRGLRDGIIAEGEGFSSTYFTPQGIAAIQAWFDDRFPGTMLTYRQALNNPTVAISVSVPVRDSEKPFVQPFFVDAKTYPLYGVREDEQGRPLSELLQTPTDIVFSRNLADDLGAEVGDIVRISGASSDFTLRGIVSASEEGGYENIFGSLFGYYYADLSAVTLFSGLKPGADQIYVKLDDPEQAEMASRRFEAHYPYLSAFSTADLEDQNAQVSDAVNQLVTIMGLVSLLIGGIGIVNTMLVIVSRRTTEVAVLKTIGLEGEQVTALFLVEAVLMGIFGSLLGIVLGWIAAFAIKGVAETFLAQTLSFRITLRPPLTGFIVGVIVTTVFGFMPTLAAGQVRPNLVLRPTDTVLPKAGRARSFAALLFVMGAVAVVAQPLIGGMLSAQAVRGAAMGVGGFLGLLMGLTLLAGGLLAGWTRRKLPLRLLRWVLLIPGVPLLGAAFGYAVPALLILFSTFLIVGVLYVVLWVIIWLVGRFFPAWRLVDLRLALRQMLAAKGRNASTLLALVIGVFTLSMITMLVTAIQNRFEEILENEVGGNVIVFSAGSGETLNRVNAVLDQAPGVQSYTSQATYQAQLISLRDVSAGRNVTPTQLRARVQGNEMYENQLDWALSTIDGRGLNANLPEVKFYAGRQLTPADEGPWDAAAGQYPPIVLSAYEGTIQAGIEVGDLVKYRVTSSAPFGIGGDKTYEITFEIVGLIDRTGAQLEVNFGSPNYAPKAAFDAQGIQPESVSAIVQVDEDQVRPLRRAMNEIPGVFVLETKMLNELITKILDQFTSFPTLVATLSLVVGGIVIANSVALSTLERRREIAIMKAVGLQRERVLGMLLLEFGLMGLIGGLIGVGLGGIGLLLLLVQAFGGELGRAIPYVTAFELMALCVLIALVAAIVTAWGASGEKPLNVLRYE